ncbi:MAG TPA: hypothetical protein VGE12_14550 [Noviherbaspirillum sp.]
MKVRHFFAALLLAFGLGQVACAEEQKQPEPQQETTRQAPAAEKAEEAAAGQDKPSVETAGSASAPASAQPVAATAPAASPASDSAMPAAAPDATTASTDAGGFLQEVKLTDALVALFAGLLVLLGWIQAKRMREAVRVASHSADVAEKSARVAEEALISGQRAFMFIREIKTFLHQDPDSGKFHWTIHPIWANSGNTPTRGLTINTSYRLLDAPLPKEFDFPAADDVVTSTIAGPRSMIEAAPGTLSNEDLQAVQEGKKHFYIWGWAEYHDIFDGTRKRVTKFCNHLVQVDGDTAAPANEHHPIQMMFGFHSENNYAD